MFNNTTNKALLWSVLQNNNVFAEFENDDFTHVHQEFEKYIKYYNDDDNFSSLPLIDQNKQFINKFRSLLSSYKHSKRKQHENKVFVSNRPIVTNESKQQNIFELRLREKQKEFEDLIKHPKPDAIDFSDKEEDNSNKSTTLEEDISNNHMKLYNERKYDLMVQNNIPINNASNNDDDLNTPKYITFEAFNKLLEKLKIIEEKQTHYQDTILSLKQQIDELSKTQSYGLIKNHLGKNTLPPLKMNDSKDSKDSNKDSESKDSKDSKDEKEINNEIDYSK